MTPIYELTVVVPTFNERDNVGVLVERLRTVLDGVAWQVIFVDDNSADGTAAAVKAIAACDARVQCLHRVGRRGLAGAALEGMMASAAPFVAVMDGDLQHDEKILPRMLSALREGDADLVVGSRYVEAASAARGLSPLRRAVSRLATALARPILKVEVTDPVSGFFMIRRDRVDAVARKLSDRGFKILFDIIASQKTAPRIVEIPYAFADRAAGESKFDGRIAIDYLGLLLSKLSGDVIPPRALMFGMVGGLGLVIHLSVLEILAHSGVPFGLSQLAAAVTAMTSNFLINNLVTYRDRRLRGWRLLGGYLRFCALCGFGLVANIAVADLIHEQTSIVWIAGVGGALFGAAWNYVSTALAVW